MQNRRVYGISSHRWRKRWVCCEWSAEQLGHYGENLFSDTDVLIGRINKAVGFNIVPPGVAGCSASVPPVDFVHMRDVAAVWAGLRLREVLRESGIGLRNRRRRRKRCRMSRGISGSRFGVVFNQDSFPEMHPDVSTVYLDRSRDLTKYLLSINQEAEASQVGGVQQAVVQELTRHVGGYRRVYRFPHWLATLLRR